MADGGSAEESVRRGVGRTLAGFGLLLVAAVLLGAWAWWGDVLYRLNPGQAAVILRFGEYAYTEAREGLRWNLPYPIETREIVNVGQRYREEFGDEGAKPASGEPAMGEASMQTGDNNIVHLEFAVQYKVRDPFKARYRVTELQKMLRDGAQAAMREVVGRHTIDGVLSDERGEVEAQALDLLQEILDRYDAGLFVSEVQLQNVQPPAAVADAFDDVIAAAQDRDRAINEAQGYANEVLPRARAEAAELVEQATGYREATVAEARGDADRFRSVVAEYRKAPAITRERLYLETMEQVLPDVETILIEPGSGPVPYLPLGRGGRLSEGTRP
ncbi:MAG: FtsH protease activity modulator HflK [Myxococcota bacterium]|nr:FtsH protease activity modulator HflK [Myxococcota bacterium]